ncbi:UNVERIFIED_CONTAM: hypothetical protein C7454_12542 [Acidovorax defluvii]
MSIHPNRMNNFSMRTGKKVAISSELAVLM